MTSTSLTSTSASSTDMSATVMITEPGRLVEPGTTVSPCSALSWMIVPSIGERIVVRARSSSAALERGPVLLDRVLLGLEFDLGGVEGELGRIERLLADQPVVDEFLWCAA